MTLITVQLEILFLSRLVPVQNLTSCCITSVCATTKILLCVKLRLQYNANLITREEKALLDSPSGKEKFEFISECSTQDLNSGRAYIRERINLPVLYYGEI